MFAGPHITSDNATYTDFLQLCRQTTRRSLLDGHARIDRCALQGAERMTGMGAEGTSGERIGSGSFHGTGEGYAKLRSSFAAVCAIAVLLYSWMNVLLAHHRPGTGRSGRVLIEALSATAILTATVMTYVSTYRRLGRLIAKGGQTAIELDKVRTDISSFALGAGLLAMLVWWSGVLSARL